MFYLAQVTRPVPFPCFGVLHKEKHVLLHSVADVVVEQGAVFAAFFCFFHLSFWTTLFFSFLIALLVLNWMRISGDSIGAIETCQNHSAIPAIKSVVKPFL